MDFLEANKEQIEQEAFYRMSDLFDLDVDLIFYDTTSLRASRRYGKYLRMLKNGQLKIDRGSIKRIAKLDGKFVVHSNDDTLSAEDMALGYK